MDCFLQFMSDHDITFDFRSLTVTTELIQIRYQARELKWLSLSFVRRRWKKKLASGKKLFNLSYWFIVRVLIPRSAGLSCLPVFHCCQRPFCFFFFRIFLFFADYPSVSSQLGSVSLFPITFPFLCSLAVSPVPFLEPFPLFVLPFLFVRAFPPSCGLYRPVTHFWQRIYFLPFSDR